MTKKHNSADKANGKQKSQSRTGLLGYGQTHPQAHFDLQGLYKLVNQKRQQSSLSWSALSAEVSVSESTIRRFETTDDAEADGVLALIRWTGVAPEYFIKDSTSNTLLDDDERRVVRVDTQSIAKALGNPLIAKRDRLTIQQLTAAAHESRMSVASLTKATRA